jgi:predicted RNA-binding protein YlxR (DUF448 family)
MCVHNRRGPDEGYFVFGFGKDDKNYYVCNEMEKARKKVKREKMNKYLRRRNRDGDKWTPRIL